jgi:hypothetical protein
VRGASTILSNNKRTGAPKDLGLIVYGLAHPFQAVKMHIHREEARIAGHAVHRPFIVSGVRDRCQERLRGCTARRASAALAGVGVRWMR